MDDKRKDAISILAVTGIVGTVFLGVGVAIGTFSTGVARLAGTAMAVMGVICLLIAVTYGVGGLLSARSTSPDAVRPAPRIVPGASVTYPRSRTGYVDVAVGVGAGTFISLFFLMGLALMEAGEPAGFGFALVSGLMWLLIVPATVLGLARLARDRTMLVLDPEGLRIHGVGWIPWQDVDRLSIEDTTQLVAEPGTRVVGSMRQLAVGLRPGAEPPRGNALDEAMRSVAKGFLAIGRAAGRGDYHWLAVRERDIDVPLEEVLDVACIFHARVVGLSGDSEVSVTAGTGTPRSAAPEAAVAGAGGAADPTFVGPASAPDPVLAAEAAALAGQASGRDSHSTSIPSHRRPAGWPSRAAIVLAGGLTIGAVGLFLGQRLIGSGPTSGPLPPWPFVVFAVLVGGVQVVSRVARRRSSWLARPLAAAVAIAIGTFVLGTFTAATIGGGPGRGGASSPASAPAQAPAPVIAAISASSEMADYPTANAADGIYQRMWNSGRAAPGWIRFDFVGPATVHRVRALVEQTPSGPTVHHVYVARGDGFDLVRTFDGDTRSDDWLTFVPDAPLEGVTSIVVETATSPSWVAWREIEIE
jgi:hypothetical protein